MNFSAWIKSYNYIVVVFFVVLSIILGILNNLRFRSEDERRVPWFGSPTMPANAGEQKDL